MVSLNRVIVAGNLIRNPELKTTNTSRKFTNLTIAINDFWKDKDGELIKKTTYINVIAWGSLAENCAKYLKKGRSIMVEGRIETDKYEDKQGKTQYMTRINSNNIVFLENSNKNNSDDEESDDSNESSKNVSKKSSVTKKTAKKPTREVFEEEAIPF